MTPRITTLGAASVALKRLQTNPDTFVRAPHSVQTARVATSSAIHSAQEGLNMHQCPPPIATDDYTTGMNPPGGSPPWSPASMRTPTGPISPKVQIDEDEAMPPLHD
ncbi:hypothetical protein CTheo_8693 [Ceratobasidium theobromae]|uniref:Uncharacterized protein n=1 Tax=Ceratobasidium theobromae TaxID=1582974 RepID=A0A5N5Q862_9AGAM|nr:hypothetical protein CTheo_8693 [Ceratobasidium theobromae]